MSRDCHHGADDPYMCIICNSYERIATLTRERNEARVQVAAATERERVLREALERVRDYLSRGLSVPRAQQGFLNAFGDAYGTACAALAAGVKP